MLEHRPRERRLLFLKAWNEWAEGNHLEPDLRSGTGFLQAVAAALGEAEEESEPHTRMGIGNPDYRLVRSFVPSYWNNFWRVAR